MSYSLVLNLNILHSVVLRKSWAHRLLAIAASSRSSTALRSLIGQLNLQVLLLQVLVDALPISKVYRICLIARSNTQSPYLSWESRQYGFCSGGMVSQMCEQLQTWTRIEQPCAKLKLPAVTALIIMWFPQSNTSIISLDKKRYAYDRRLEPGQSSVPSDCSHSLSPNQ